MLYVYKCKSFSRTENITRTCTGQHSLHEQPSPVLTLTFCNKKGFTRPTMSYEYLLVIRTICTCVNFHEGLIYLFFSRC